MSSVWSYLTDAVTAHPTATIATVASLGLSTLIFGGCYASEVWPETINKRRSEQLRSAASNVRVPTFDAATIKAFKNGKDEEPKCALSVGVLSAIEMAQASIDGGHAFVCHMRELLGKEGIDIEHAAPHPLVSEAQRSSVAPFVHALYGKKEQ